MGKGCRQRRLEVYALFVRSVESVPNKFPKHAVQRCWLLHSEGYG